MSIVEKENLIKRVSEVVGSDDESLTLIEDLTDTLNAASDSDKIKELENQIVETEEKWRNKYKERFLHSESEDDDKKEDNDKKEDDDKKEDYDYESLFEEE